MVWQVVMCAVSKNGTALMRSPQLLVLLANSLSNFQLDNIKARPREDHAAAANSVLFFISKAASFLCWRWASDVLQADKEVGAGMGTSWVSWPHKGFWVLCCWILNVQDSNSKITGCEYLWILVWKLACGPHVHNVVQRSRYCIPASIPPQVVLRAVKENGGALAYASQAPFLLKHGAWVPVLDLVLSECHVPVGFGSHCFACGDMAPSRSITLIVPFRSSAAWPCHVYPWRHFTTQHTSSYRSTY